MVMWYICQNCGKTIDEFDSDFLYSINICRKCWNNNSEIEGVGFQLTLFNDDSTEDQIRFKTWWKEVGRSLFYVNTPE